MLELLLTVGLNKALSAIGGIRSTNQIGQITYSNLFGHCLSPNKKKFYAFFGRNAGSTFSPALWVYDISTNLWASLGAPTVAYGTNSYWSITAIDDDTLYMSCRFESLIYKVTAKTWKLGGTIPASANIYGARSHTYKGKVYLFANNAGTGIPTANVYDPVTNVTTTLKSGTVSNGVYACSTLVGDKIYSFEPVTAATGKLQIYDITLNTITIVDTKHRMNSNVYSHYKDGYIYMYGSNPTNKLSCTRFNIGSSQFDPLPSLIREVTGPMGYTIDEVTNLWAGTTPSGDSLTDFLTYQLIE